MSPLWTQYGRATAPTWSLLLLALAACVGEEPRGADGVGSEAPGQAAQAEALAEAPEGLAEEDGPLNITFEPIEIPDTDFASAAPEAEPNDDDEAATPMAVGAIGASGNVQFTATGTVPDRDTDYFSFSVEGEPQLYLIEAVGGGVDRMRLHDAGGLVRTGMRPGQEASGRHTITNVHLAPGDYRVSVESYRGSDMPDYTLRVVPLGPVDPYVEREPNDDASVAERLDFGVVRRGLLYEDDDTDFYRFSLAGEDLIRLRLEVPPEITPFLALEEGFPTGSTQNRTAEPGAPVEYTALLQPGDYFVRVQSRLGTSQAPYALTLRRLNRFDTPVDLEPNDVLHQARSIPSDGLVVGHVGDFGDSDWYALPPLSAPTRLVLRQAELVDVEGPRRTGNTYVWTAEGASVRLARNAADTTWTADLPEGQPLFLELRGTGHYALRLELDPAPAAASDAPAGVLTDVVVEMPSEPLGFAAFWDRWQQARVDVTLRNDGTEPRTLRLATSSTHRNWTLRVPSAEVRLGPGERTTLEARVTVAPDAPDGVPVQLAVQASDDVGRRAVAAVPAFGACRADPVDPGGPFLLPEALLGGLNVAWSALGGSVVQAPAGSAAFLQPYLIDGITSAEAGWYVNARAYPADVTVELAGDAPVPVAGVILNPLSDLRPAYLIRRFEVLLSTDGQEFTRALEGEMSQDRVAQPFVLPEPTEARFARLRILSSWNPNRSGQGQTGVGEFQVIAAPGVAPVGAGGFNLADPSRGGYVARSAPTFYRYGEAEMMLTEGVEGPTLRIDPVNPIEWVVGFHHNRAAQIRELQWVDGAEDGRESRFETVQVSVSLSSPVGPWTTLGTWTLDRSAGQPAPYVLPSPVWARFVRFVSADALGARTPRWQVPETLRILERATDGEYRSILGEWGHYDRAGIYERLGGVGGDAGPVSVARGNDQRNRALELEPGAAYADRVERGERAAWYRYDVPRGENRLRFDLRGLPSVDVAAELESADGQPVELERLDVEGGIALEAEVEGGQTYWLRLVEPVRRIVVTWDNSGSVRQFKPAIYRALTDFSRRLRPGTEYVKLLPFRPGGFLLTEWTDQALPVERALQAYNRMDDDSNAERYLLTASRSLGAEEGARAVIVLADAETFSYELTADLWKSLERARPRVFAMELHRGDGAAHQQDLMQSWSTVNGGHYAHFAGESDLDVAFDRAFCMLRRPVRFAIEASSRYEAPPPPGRLAVEVEGVVASNAVELILDASGSMLQRIGGKRRIEIARDVLTELVDQTLPEGIPLALRIFGHRTPDACDTELVVPLGPLDRAAVTQVIRGTQAMNLARTPIGESLRLVAEDLERVDGQRLVVLITDGEETCDGDPAESIRALKEQGLDMRVSIVGFAIDDRTLKAQFEEWAGLGGGRYFDASSEEELGRALEAALRPKYQVLGPGGDVVAEGTAGGEPVTLPVGSYTVNVLSNPVQVFTNVRIESEQQQTLRVGGSP